MSEKKQPLLDKINEHVFTKTALLILAVLGGLVTLAAYFQNQAPKIQFEILSNYNVLDINADISNLDIIYDSSSLKDNNQNLRVVTIRVVNRGNEEITIDDFDNKYPLSLSVKEGQLIESPEVIDASNSYLKQRVVVSKVTTNEVIFDSFILEEDEFFILKNLVLHNSSIVPAFSAFGKIAGQHEIEIVNEILQENSTSFVYRAFSGTFLTQMARTVAYTALTILLFSILVNVFQAKNKFITKRKRERLVQKFEGGNSKTLTKMDDAIFERYCEEGPIRLLHMYDFISNENLLSSHYQLRLQSQRKVESKGSISKKWDRNELIDAVLEDGMATVEHDKLVVNYSMKRTLKEFLSFLVTEGELSAERVEGST